MRPIEYRTDIDFRQALRCVEFRIAPLRQLRPRGFTLGLGLRYGLVGTAAVHHLLQGATPEEERAVLESAIGWSQVVTDHIQHMAIGRLPMEVQTDVADHIGRLAQLPVHSAVPLLRRHCPLEVCLQIGVDDFIQSHRQDIRQGWGWFKGRSGERLFADLAAASMTVATNFHARRSFDLEEVREIALLGE
ncbi:MAG: hypothetical protein ACO1SV_11065 [Fimbriimonas sp.]